jgi:pseudaminic acid synthase
MTSRKTISIGGRPVGLDHAPFIIAEMSGNHNHSLDRALALVDAAASAGAHALKLQTYTADTMTLPLKEGAFVIEDPNSLWHGRSLYDLYEEAHTPWDWHGPLFERARERGMVPFSTPFDDTAVDFLEDLDVASYKIASFEMTDLNLVRRVAATGKPMIISTGMGSVAEIAETVETARAAGADDLILLKCTSAYPSTPEDANILTIPNLRATFGCEVGLSDHTMGVGVSIASVAHGATVIEKHFTLARADGGVDSAFSLEPDELASLVTETERAWASLGKVSYGTTSAQEKKSLAFRRSLYISEDIQAGAQLTTENVRAIRPGYGLPTKHLETVLGRRAACDLKAGTAIDWDILN